MRDTGLLIRRRQSVKKSSVSENMLRIGSIILIAWLAVECFLEIVEIQNHYQNHYVNTFENLTKKQF